MQALILAAGRGSRLGQKGKDLPKCLLQIGRKHLVEHQLETFAEAGVAPVGMVVGYCADEIQEVVGIRAEYIENPRWSTTNSLYSFFLAREWIRGDFVVLNSDTLVHPDILERLLRAKGDAFAYDSHSGDAREHMKVKLEGNRLMDMSKDMPERDVAGENVGMLKFTADSGKRLFEIAEKLIDEDGEKDWLGSSVRVLARERVIQGVDVSDLAWGEIDSSYDLERARKEVLPAIEKSIARKHPFRRIGRAVGLLAVIGVLAFALRTWAPVPNTVWETVHIENLPKVAIKNNGTTHLYWLLDKDGIAEATVAGGGMLRIDARHVVDEPTDESVPFLLEITLDGKRLDWFTVSEHLSATWKADDFLISRKGRYEHELPDEGGHQIGVRILASETGRCILRIRTVQTAEEE